MGNIAYKCPTCGAELGWNAGKQEWVCEYCDGAFTLEDLKASGHDKIDEQNVQKHEEIEEGEHFKSNDGTEGNNLVKYTCSHCGAEIITDRSTAATICVYCASPVILSEQLIDDFTPNYVIPFRVEKNSVMDVFKKFSKKPLTPKDFDCDAIVDKMQGVYIPFWLYSGKCSGQLNAEGANIRSWKSGEYQYTERKIYNVFRSGNCRFTNIPVDASSKTDNDAMDSIEPYDYSDLKEFNYGYLAGYLAERFDEDKQQCYVRAQERMANSTMDALKNTCNYSTVSVKKFDKNINIDSTEYALLPTWLLHTTYKNEKYLFAMNGQTGKFIGNLPIDKAKLALFSFCGGCGGFLLGAALAAMGIV